MDIQNKTVLIIGAWGLVGNAITRRIIPEKPAKLILTSLREKEITEYRKKLLEDFPELSPNQIKTWWGNIFVREEFKDEDRYELLENADTRADLIKDVMEDLDEEILQKSSLYQLIVQSKPDIVIDCVNTATGIAYQDVYTTYKHIKKLLRGNPSIEELKVGTEKLLATIYVPQLIRHIQLMYTAMSKVKTKAYLKIGTSGTGGMGLNIPYTHSEEKPSRVLLSKSAIGGAHSLLLFLMGRTPESTITKEIKPTAAIAWKEIGYGEISKGGRPVEVLDIPVDRAIELNGKLEKNIELADSTHVGHLQSVYIDTGENGVFSRGEFEALTAQGQMEFVTPEEIAQAAVFEIVGGNTGHDIINALDNATLEPSYRAGFLQHRAVEKLAEFEKKSGKESIAFEQIGPPRLSKLLIECHLLKKICLTLEDIPNWDAQELSSAISGMLHKDDGLRNEIIAIGIPILYSNGKSLLRGPLMKVPKMIDEDALDISDTAIDRWAHDGWVDLRIENMLLWKERVAALIEEARVNTMNDTSSQHVRTPEYWNEFKRIDIGKVVSWIFIHEEHGKRMKA
jgi:hypothetical protein